LLDRGWTKEEIDWRIRKGRLHRVHAGVYSLGPRQLLTRQGWWMAAVLASGPDALLSHWSAASLWLIRPNSRSRIEVTVPHRSRSSKAVYRHISHVPPDERTLKDGIPATSVHRTIYDLSSTVSTDDVIAMIKEAEYLNLYDRLSLWDLLERYPARRGSRNLRFAPTPLQRLDPPGGQALPGRLPLAEAPHDRRARRLGGAQQPLGLPRRPPATGRSRSPATR
jgi:hypothetical protein